MGNAKRIAGRLAAYDIIRTLEGTLEWIGNIGRECGEDVLREQLPDGFGGRAELRGIINNRRGLEHQKTINTPRTTRSIAAAVDMSGIIPDDGFADGGTPYTDEEMNVIDRDTTYNHCQSCGARVPTNSLTSVDRDSTSPDSGLMSVCKGCQCTQAEPHDGPDYSVSKAEPGV